MLTGGELHGHLFEMKIIMIQIKFHICRKKGKTCMHAFILLLSAKDIC